MVTWPVKITIGTDAGEAAAATREAESEPHVSAAIERGLMLFSLAIAVGGILLARKFYVTSPNIAGGLADRWAGAHRVLSHKYLRGRVVRGDGDCRYLRSREGVVGVRSGRPSTAWSTAAGWITIVSAWFSGLTDRTVVDGLVNLVGRICERGSFGFRRVQTGLVQNYAMLMLFGIFAFVSIYLFMR